jgi:hypothetical protein
MASFPLTNSATFLFTTACTERAIALISHCKLEGEKDMAVENTNPVEGYAQPVNNGTVVAVFENRSHADAAIHELEEVGFREDQIGFIVKHPGTEENMITGESGKMMTGPDAAKGAVSGGILGGIAGAVAALLIPGVGPIIAGGIIIAALSGIALGAAAGGLVGIMMGLDVPEEEAKYYESEFQLGRSVVIVQAGDRARQARAILHQHGGYDANTRFTQGEAQMLKPTGPAETTNATGVTTTPPTAGSGIEESPSISAAGNSLFEHPTNPNPIEPLPGRSQNIEYTKD